MRLAQRFSACSAYYRQSQGYASFNGCINRRLTATLPRYAKPDSQPGNPTLAGVETGRRTRQYTFSRVKQKDIPSNLLASLADSDPEVWDLLKEEQEMNGQSLNLMAMECYPTKAVYQADNAYLPAFEGYPGKRYHLGTRVVDAIEELCWKRAYEAFNISAKEWAVNAQAMTGSLANLYAYTALMQPGQSMLRMELSHGGHISHGHQTRNRKISETAYRFESVPYHIDSSTGLIDYDEVSSLARRHRPRLTVAGGSSYCRYIDFKCLKRIADEVGALLHYDMSHFCGFVASGVDPSPFPFCDIVTTTPYKTLRGPQGALIISRRRMAEAIDATVFPRYQCGTSYRNMAAMAVVLRQARTEAYRMEQRMFLECAKVLSRQLSNRGYRILGGGTDRHMLLLDLRPVGVTGLDVETVLGAVNIVANQNAIPGDIGMRFSGLRLASPPMVIRGMKMEDFIHVAGLVDRAIKLTRWLVQNVPKPEVGTTDDPISGGPGRRTFVHLNDGSYHPEVLRLRQDVVDMAVKYPLPSYLYGGM